MVGALAIDGPGGGAVSAADCGAESPPPQAVNNVATARLALPAIQMLLMRLFSQHHPRKELQKPRGPFNVGKQRHGLITAGRRARGRAETACAADTAARDDSCECALADQSPVKVYVQAALVLP